ncbi:hypothetical protein ACTFIY_003152 [Dictyostelium cf. discoideum]
MVIAGKVVPIVFVDNKVESIGTSVVKPSHCIFHSGKNILWFINNYKIGDEVYSIHYNSSSSHIIVDKDHKFKVGNFSITKESILIHSASGGVGLSALELLKWKNHKGYIFVTVE